LLIIIIKYIGGHEFFKKGKRRKESCERERARRKERKWELRGTKCKEGQ
jgi:hypothetical protein